MTQSLFTAMDHLARDFDDLRRIVLRETRRGVRKQVIEENIIFTGDESPMVDLMLNANRRSVRDDRQVYTGHKAGGGQLQFAPQRLCVHRRGRPAPCALYIWRPVGLDVRPALERAIDRTVFGDERTLPDSGDSRRPPRRRDLWNRPATPFIVPPLLGHARSRSRLRAAQRPISRATHVRP